MKKTLIFSTLAVAVSAASISAEPIFDPEKKYTMKHASSGYYLNINAQGERNNPTLQAEPTVVKIAAKEDDETKYSICTTGGLYIVKGGNNWDLTTKTNCDYYWSVTETTTKTGDNTLPEYAFGANHNNWGGFKRGLGVATATLGAVLQSNKSGNSNVDSNASGADELQHWIVEEYVVDNSTTPMDLSEYNGKGVLLKGYNTNNYLTGSDGYNATCVDNAEPSDYAVWTITVGGEGNNEIQLTNVKNGRHLFGLGVHDSNASTYAAYVVNESEGTFVLVNTAATEAANRIAPLPNSFGYSEVDADAQWVIEVYEEPATLTVTYKYNGQVLSTEEIIGKVGTTYTTTIPAFFTDAPRTGILSKEVTTLEVNLEHLNLPFQYTATKENLIWQAIQPRTDAVDRKWKYDPDQPDCIAIKQINNNNAEGFTDKELWAIVGDIFNGFEIYNKAAGLNKPLNFQGGDGFAKLSEATENTRWNIAQGNVENSVAFYISTKPDHFLNYNVTNQKMQWHGTADVGSSCRFVAPATPLLAYSGDCNTTVGNFVGAYLDECGLTGARAAANADLYDLEAAEALKSAIAKHAAHQAIAFDVNKWYRFKGKVSSQYMVTGKDDSYDIWGGETSQLTNHNSIMKFVETDQEGVYNILSQGKYFGQLGALETQLRQADEQQWAGKYAIENFKSNGHFFLLRDIETQHHHTAAGYTDRIIDCIHDDQTSNKIIPQLEDWDRSAWYLEIADKLVVSLPVQEGEDYYGLGYFPFPVKVISDDITLNYLTPRQTQDHKLALGYNTVESVEANTAFLIIAKSNTVTLTINYDGLSAQGIEENVLRGNYRSATAEAGDFVLTTNASGAPVFAKQDVAPTVAGNTGYIPAAALPTTHVNAAELPVLNVEVTLGISEIGVDSAATGAIYDLQGRRLAAPVKGINIIGGQKVLVK